MGCCSSQQQTYDLSYFDNSQNIFPAESKELNEQRIPKKFQKKCCSEKPAPPEDINCFKKKEVLDLNYQMKTILFVYNPFSGNGRARKNKDKVIEIFKKKGIEIQGVIETPGPQEIIEIIAKDDRVDKVDCVVAMGGDGTLKEVIEGIVKRSRQQKKERTIPVGLIAGGTGNSFTGSIYGLDKRYDYEYVVNKIIQGKPTKCDFLEVDYYNSKKKQRESQIGLNLVAMGVGVSAALSAEKLRCLGPIRYDVAILYRIFKDGTQPFQIQVQENKGQLINISTNLIIATNCFYVGDGLRITPFSQVDDGYMDVGITDNMGSCQTLDLFGKIKDNGTHIYDKNVIYGRTKSMDIESINPAVAQIDGEITDYISTPLKISTIESYLTLVI